MNGIKYLLDTNFILGLLKKNSYLLTNIEKYNIKTHECAYSAITRMELLGFPNITPSEKTIIEEKLYALSYIPITPTIEDNVIEIRKLHKIKLPDAIILATAKVHQLTLMTLDQQLQSLANP